MANGETNNRTIGPVTTATVTGAAAAGLLAWTLKTLFGIDMPTDVVGYLSILITVAGGLLGGWLVRPGTGKRRDDVAS